MTTGGAVTGSKRGDVPGVDTASFQTVRPRLFGIGYRLLGSAAEADDVVQDTWIRWQGAERGKVRDAAAFLATTTTRLAINVAQSAHARHETCIGPGLPEPVDTKADPPLAAERGEALDLAVLTVLEKLSPTERGAYVLREAFDYPYRQISKVLGLSEENARQLVSRARTHLSNECRRQVSISEQQRFLDAFLAAARHGDFATLERLLVADVVTSSHVGGVVDAAGIAVVGRARAAALPVGLAA
jgi:RNA polymerase sigma-70 factor (ECF subfamily)